MSNTEKAKNAVATICWGFLCGIGAVASEIYILLFIAFQIAIRILYYTFELTVGTVCMSVFYLVYANRSMFTRMRQAMNCDKSVLDNVRNVIFPGFDLPKLNRHTNTGE